MSETSVITDEMKVQAAKNEWGKTFILGDQQFEIKDLGYFDYLEFVQLVKPLISLVTNGLQLTNNNGEIDVEFDHTAIDIDQIIGLSRKELPRMAWLICKQSNPQIKEQEVAMLARRPQRLLEVVLMQILHNEMIQEFAGFFTRLTAMANVLMPSVAKMVTPSETESTTEETPSS